MNFARDLAEALEDQIFVTLNVYEEKADHQITGLITKIDQELRRVKVSHDEGSNWILFNDILNVKLTK